VQHRLGPRRVGLHQRQACRKTRSIVLPHLLRLRRHPRGEAASVRATLYSTLLRLSIVGLGMVER
jgi:hypothetical protein